MGKMKIQLELHQKQIELLIRLVDDLIARVNSKKKDPFKMGVDEYINLAHDLEAGLDTIYHNKVIERV